MAAATIDRLVHHAEVLPVLQVVRDPLPFSEVLPLLYLHGLSGGDFIPALEQFLGSAAGLSAATVDRLTKQWQGDHVAFQRRDLFDSDYVYVWADGVHPRSASGRPMPASWC